MLQRAFLRFEVPLLTTNLHLRNSISLPPVEDQALAETTEHRRFKRHFSFTESHLLLSIV
jgi:hypothetical protein